MNPNLILSFTKIPLTLTCFFLFISLTSTFFHLHFVDLSFDAIPRLKFWCNTIVSNITLRNENFLKFSSEEFDPSNRGFLQEI